MRLFFLFSGIVVFLFLAIMYFVIGSDHKFQRQPSSQPSTQKVENFIHFESIRLVDFKPKQFFLVSNSSSFSQISISNEIKDSTNDLDLKLTCDQGFFLNGGKNEFHNYSFKLKNKHQISFLLSKNVQKCELVYKSVDFPARAGLLELRSEAVDFPWLKELVLHQEVCDGLTSSAIHGSDSFFINQKNPQLSCIYVADLLETLETPESGFLAKVEMLLGKKLDASFLAKQDPHAEIDFSLAPKLDGIFLATLVYRADFYGTVMARLLKYHADQGAVVHLMTTAYMMLEKDQKLLFGLAAENGNFRLQPFKYYDPNYDLFRPARYIDTKYRDMHIKLFITLAKAEKDNAVILGGRNIHDGFLFKTIPDYSRFPDLVQYGIEDDFVHWNDFEMKITSKEVAKITAAHFLNFWNRDTATQARSDFTGKGSLAAKNELTASGPNQLRHFISVPYSDNHALEDLFVSLIDNAQKTIRISSPYLRPTTKIMAAIQRAVGRKVDIVIQTRVNLQGDTQAWLYEEVNKESINKLFQMVKIFEWTEDSILHSKFILVDDEIAFIGSVNLSRRSFIQDVENGYLVKSSGFVKQMNVIFESYLAKSKQITQAKERQIGPSILIKLLKDQF
ncbi:MAG: phosphatidylserine/phosphatidylglycerophosphate/cardiolipin synthase family protein [Bdellovibrionaceae bacterium]|nr:phosphatidylserine/phosphatidylglycerophosphate/cardiolipin synthase family protein [Pseudobdellovibrionaceae bacterium]